MSRVEKDERIVKGAGRSLQRSICKRTRPFFTLMAVGPLEIRMV
jgi:hypothetical protein